MNEAGFYSPERINARIDAYVAGVTARHDGQTAAVNPHEKGSESYINWRTGYIEAPMYWTGNSKLFLVREEPTVAEAVDD